MKILTITAKSATFELDGNLSPYFSGNNFLTELNGKLVRQENRNVFSVFGLSPDTDYKFKACGETVKFRTNPVSAEISVDKFGAKGDGIHDDTGAFTAAMNCLPINSVLVVPEGVYLLKPVFLKSGITVYLEKGAKILASAARGDYSILPGVIDGNGYRINAGTWQGEEDDCFASVFTAYGQNNIAIIGEGEIDCCAPQGDWYLNHRVKRGAWRPRGLFFNRCDGVLVQGITVKNTPSWCIHPYFCTNVKLYDMNIENPADIPTTDGVDPDCCDTVEIVGLKISVGDDCIAIKSGTLESAKRYKTPCRNIVIRNCLMRDGHGGVVFGSELSGGIENVYVTRCLFEGTDRGFRIKTRRGRGRVGSCGDVTFSDVVMKNVKVPFVINMYYNMGDETGHTEYVWSTEKLPVDERTPQIGSFVFKNMVCTGVEYSAAAFYGLPESPIKSIAFDHVSFTYNEQAEAGFPDMREHNEAVKNQGLDFRNVQKVMLKNVVISGQSGEPVLTQNVKKITAI